MAHANITKKQAEKLRRAARDLYVNTIISKVRYHIVLAKIKDEAEKRER